MPRWRWNLNRSLAVLRFRGGKKNPLPIQRMESDDLMAAVFPALAACQENAVAGPIVIPDHVLVRQTMYDCLHEAMDLPGLLELLGEMESGAVRTHFVESTEPSVLSHEILNGKPYTFLDDAPLEERRTRAVQMRRGLPLEARALGRLDSAALQRVRAEAAPAPRDAEELHDLMLSLVVFRPDADNAPHRQWFDALLTGGRAMEVVVPGPDGESGAENVLWCAVERRPYVDALFPGASFRPDRAAPASATAETGGEAVDADEAAAEAVRGQLDVSGPITVTALAYATALTPSRIRVGLGRLEAEGFAMRGDFDPALQSPNGEEAEQWCARRLLARIHSYTQNRLRREIEPVTSQDLVRFLLRWQHVAPGTKRQGRAGLMAVIDQLQGFEIPAGAWEDDILAARVENYQHRWLEDLCLSGELVWGRFSLRPADPEGEPRRGATTPSRATPVTFAQRDDLAWLLQSARGTARPVDPAHGAACDVLEALRRNGALFHGEIRTITGRLPVEVEEGLWDLVSRGIVTADGFQAVRSLLSARDTWNRRHRHEVRNRIGGRRTASLRQGGEGRWALLPAVTGDEDTETLAEQVVGQLLARWGVVFWDITTRENLSVPWRHIVWALRRLEARGIVRGGRFVSGFSGEQYALPEAVDELRRIRRTTHEGETISLSGADPLNVVGIVLPGARVPAVRTNRVTYRDGVVATPDGAVDALSSR